MKTKILQTEDDYLKLVLQFPLKKIRDDKHAEAAFTFITPLVMKGEDSDQQDRLSPGESDYLAAMNDLLESYEQNQPAFPQCEPLEMVRFLMDEHRMSSSDLGRLLGNRSLGTNILSGRRELSKANIRRLAEHFKISAALFI